MGWMRRVVSSSVVLGLAVGPAFAQPDLAGPPDPETAPVPDPPPEPPAAPPPEAVPTPAPAPAAAPLPSQPPPAVSAGPETGYPRAFAARPLVLPAGAFEGTGLLAIATTDFGSDSLTTFTLQPRARYSFGTAEVEAGVGLFLAWAAPDSFMASEPDRLTSVFAAARFAVTRDQSVGAGLTATGITGDYSTYQPMAVFTHRAHLAPGSALEASIGGGLSYTSYETAMVSTSSKSLVVAGQLRAIAQVSGTTAVEGRADYALWKPIGDEMSPLFPSTGATLHQSYGARIVASVSAALDIVAGLDVLLSGDADAKVFSLGVVGRSVP